MSRTGEMGKNADRFSDTEIYKKQMQQTKLCYIQVCYIPIGILESPRLDCNSGQFGGKTQGILMRSDQIIKYPEFKAKYLTNLRGNVKSLKVFKSKMTQSQTLGR